jgi:hypothetical protein
MMSESGGQKIEKAAREVAQKEIDQSDIGKRK